MRVDSRIETVLKFLSGRRYRLDAYQRRYVWTDRDVKRFLIDLERRSIDWQADAGALPWFLGTVIVDRETAEPFLVDGQQRAVTLGVALLAARPYVSPARRKDIDLALGGDGKLPRLPVFNPDYEAVFDAVARDPDARPRNLDPPAFRIAQAYQLTREWFADLAGAKQLDGALEGLLYRTHLNVLTVSDRELAHLMFHSVNATGQKLRPAEALKGALLQHVASPEREQIGAAWDHAEAGAAHGGPAENLVLDAMRAAVTARAAPPAAFAKRGAHILDEIRKNPFDWLAESTHSPVAPAEFARELPFFIRINGRLNQAANEPTPTLEAVHFAALCGLKPDAWTPLVFAALDPLSANPPANASRAAAALTFIDIVAARVAWRPGWMGPAEVRDRLTMLAPELRDASPAEIVDRLALALKGEFANDFDVHKDLRMSAGALTKRSARALLARITAHVDGLSNSGETSYAALVRTGAGGFEIDHLIPDGRGGKELKAHRDCLGALVLAPAPLEAQHDEIPPPDRFSRFARARNALAVGLATGGQGDAGLRRAIQSGALAPVLLQRSSFGRETVGQRQEAYGQIADAIWSPVRLRQAADAPGRNFAAALGLLALA